MNRKGIVFIFVAVLFVFVAHGIADGSVSKIYWTDRNTGKIHRANLNGKGVEDLVTRNDGLRSPRSIALDVSNNKMYWIDSGTRKIQRANLNGEGVEDLVTRADGLRDPRDIALDVSNRKIYWTDRGTRKIHRANLNGKGVEDFVTELDNLESIALDASNGKIYWTGVDILPGRNVGVIRRANLDRSNVEALDMRGLNIPQNIVLDVSNRQMYWTDLGTNTYRILRANLNGFSGKDLTATGFGHPGDIALDVSNRKIYWTNWGAGLGNRIRRANLDGPKINVEDLIYGDGSHDPYGIALDVSGVDSDNKSTAQPDLAVESPSASKTTLSPGESFTLSVRVVNRGTADSPSTTLRYYRSVNKAVATSETQFFPAVVGPKRPTSSTNFTSGTPLNLEAPDTPGTYYYSICIDPVENEITTDNNCITPIKITVGQPVSGKPDLVVESPRVSKSTLAPGESFRLSATVRNRGNGQANSTTLKYYLSTDADIDNKDKLVDTDSVSALAAYRTSDESVTLNAPTTPGTYYYYAWVSAVANEISTDNNWSRAVKVTVPQTVAQKPDLVVELDDRWSELDLLPGQSFRLFTTEKNNGTAESPATTLRYYRSSDRHISKSDTQIDTRSMKALGAGRSRWGGSGEFTAPNSPGTYYYGVCVDNVPGESNPNNNCSTALKVTVVKEKPDLVVEPPVPNKATLSIGEYFTLPTTVRNIGNGRANSTTLKYYLSTDKEITTSDTQVGTLSVNSLGAGHKVSKLISFTPPLKSGTYYYGACVDSVLAESNIKNNCSIAVRITVKEVPGLWTVPFYWTNANTDKIQRANLDNSSIEDLAPFYGLNVPPSGIALDVANNKMYWTNSGTAKIQRANLDGSGVVEDLLTGADGLHNPSGIALDVANNKMYWIDHTRTPFKAKIQRANLNGSKIEDLLTDADGLRRPIGIALDVANNKMYWTDTETDKIQRANLNGNNVEDLLTSQDGLGYPYGIALDVSNNRMYWTDNSTNKIQRANLNGDNIEDLVTTDRFSAPRGIALDVANNKMYWTSSGYIRRANLDGNNVEDLIVGVFGAEGIALDIPTSTVPVLQPDLTVESVQAFLPFVLSISGRPITVAPGDKFNLRFTVRNQGTGRSTATIFRYYRSDDDTIDTNDKQLGTGKRDPLPADGGIIAIPTVTAPDTPGTYYYGVCVDSVENESNIGNNCSTAVKVIVKPPSDDHGDTLADATPISVGIVRPGVVDRSRLMQGVIGTRDDVDYFRVEVTGAGRLTVWTTGSLDTVGELQNSTGNSVTSNDNAGSGRNFRIQRVVNSSTYYVKVQGRSGNTGSYTLHVEIALDDPDSTADLIAQGTWVSDKTLAPGESFRLGVAVMNVGDALSPATTLKYYRSSDDDKISTSDIEVDTDAVSRIATGGKSEEQITLTAPDTPGTYYYGACVESVKNEGTTNNNCSPAVKVTVEPPDDYGDTRAEAAPLPLNGSLNGVIETGADIDYFRVEVSEPGILAIWTTGPLDTIGQLQDGSGTVLASEDDNGSGKNFSIELANPVTAGTYYIKVESYLSNTGDYTIHASFVQQPDLVIESAWAEPSTVAPGDKFKLYSILKNQGTGQSAATILRYYHSDDDTIDETSATSDTQIGTGKRNPLFADGTIRGRFTVTAPNTPGTYYYGVCVDHVENESDTGNNCSEVVSITVSPQTNAVVRVTPASLTQGVGEPVTLKIDFADVQDILGYNFTLEFDSAKLRYLSSRYYGALGPQGTQVAVPPPKLSLNKVTLGAMNIQGSEISGTSTFALITFQMLQSGTSTLKLSDVKLTQEDGNVVYPRVEHGQITGTVLPPQQNIVKLIYFLPKDRDAQQNIDEKIDTLIRDAQQFFAKQMEQKNVHVRKTFTFETDAAGKAVVHQVNGALTNDEYYESTWHEVKSEVEAVFDTSRSLFFIAAELESERIGNSESSVCGKGGPHRSYESGRWTSLTTKIGGIALIPASGSCFERPTLTYHELGHAFGLLHDFRSYTYMMAYGSRRHQLSNCAAEWLDASRFFNSNQPLINDEVTRIEMLPLVANRQKTINFTITDADSLHQVQLIVAPNDEKPPPGYPYSEETWRKLDHVNKQYLHACKRLNGESDTVEFSTDGLNADEVMLQVIDKYGNFVRQNFSLPSYDHGDTAANATPLPLDSSLAGEIETGTDVDYFRIEVNVPGTLIVHTTGSLDTMGELQESSGARLANNDDAAGNNTNFRIKHTVTAGTYYIKVRSYDVDTGAYTVHVRFVPDKRVDVRQFTYWTSSVDGIQRANLDGSARDPFFSTETPIDIALDVAGEQIYWTDTNHRIQRANLDGTGTPDLIISRKDFPNPENILSLGAIALDVANNKMYWIVHPEEIWWANLDGSNPKRLLTTKNPNLLGLDTEPTDIALDVLRNDIYWSEFSNFRTRIWRADLNGKNRQIIIDLPHTAHEIHGIALDVTKNKVYWTNSKGPSIWYANTLDSDPELLIDLPERGNRSLRKPYDIALDIAGEQIYWTYAIDALPDIIGYGIARSNIEGFGEPEILFTYSPKDSSTGKVRRDGLLRIALGVSAMSDTNLIAGALAPNAPWSRVQETALLPNYPNPFNPETWIPYQLAKPADVTLTIYDIKGPVVRALDLGHQRAGIYHSRSRAAYWDGRNAQGEPVASGVYFYTLKTGDFSATRKMLIRK